MTTTLNSEDGKLSFTFESERWTMIRAFDTLPDVEKYCKSKVDFIGLLDKNRLFFIEVKNLRDRPNLPVLQHIRADDTSNYDRKNPPLVKAVVESVKDSLLFAALNARFELSEQALWQEMRSLVLSEKVQIYAVFCLETDNEYPNLPAEKLKVHKDTILKRLKASLHNICKDVFIIDSNSKHLIPELTVSYIS